MESTVSITAVTKKLYLGEGPHWDAERQLLYFVDLYKSGVHSYNPRTKEHYYATVGEKPVTFIIPMHKEKNKFVISYDRHLEIIDWDGKSDRVVRKRHMTVENRTDSRMNDAKASPNGVLVAGSMANEHGKTIAPNQGNLYLIKGDTVKTLLHDVGISNGLAWNAKQTEFYWNDTLDGKTYKFDWNAQTETLSNQTVLINFESKNIPGKPDGMTIDSEGFLWISCIKGGQIIKVNPQDGEILRTIKVPATDVTSVTFAGPSLQDMYCTTSVHNVAQEDLTPEAGCILKITGLGSKGLPGVPVKLF